MAATQPTEGKVWSAATGGTAGATLAAFLTWVLGITVWGAPSDADGALAAIAAVPWPVVGVLGLALTFGGGYISGWLAKHSPRPPESPVVNTGEVIPRVISNTPKADADNDGRDDISGRYVKREANDSA